MSSDSSVTAAFTPIAAPASAGLPALSDVHLGSDAFLSRKGTALRLTLSEAATINVSVTQAQSGRIVKGRCKAGAKQGKRCTIAVVKANLTFTGGAGSNLFALLVRSLAPGHYTATITAVADGQSSTPVPLSFTIEKPKPKRR
jgi:hypothetical protein